MFCSFSLDSSDDDDDEDEDDDEEDEDEDEDESDESELDVINLLACLAARLRPASLSLMTFPYKMFCSKHVASLASRCKSLAGPSHFSSTKAHEATK